VPFVKLGRLVRFDPVEVEAWIGASRVAPQRAPVGLMPSLSRGVCGLT
jgi:hypothetical protein